MPEVDASYVPYITRSVGGAEVKFGKFNARDRANVLKDIRKERRDALEANCKTAGLAADQTFTELEAFDDTPRYGTLKFIEYVNSDEGVCDVLERSLLKYNDQAAADKAMTGMGDTDGFALVIEICNLTLKAKESEGSPNPTEPQPPQGYGT